MNYAIFMSIDELVKNTGVLAGALLQCTSWSYSVLND
jgi:hypothetical protein